MFSREPLRILECAGAIYMEMSERCVEIMMNSRQGGAKNSRGVVEHVFFYVMNHVSD